MREIIAEAGKMISYFFSMLVIYIFGTAMYNGITNGRYTTTVDINFYNEAWFELPIVIVFGSMLAYSFYYYYYKEGDRVVKLVEVALFISLFTFMFVIHSTYNGWF